ncbi:MAG TPA: hypothetical protein ENN73_01220, partial [Firmicutes bacterium]|nr:hypothetical protein [Bacillota bacterium]
MNYKRSLFFLLFFISSVIFIFQGCPKPGKPPVSIDHGKDRVEKVIDVKKPKKIKEEELVLFIPELRYYLNIKTGKTSKINLYTSSFPTINLINQYWEVPEMDLVQLEKDLEKRKFTKDDFINNPSSYSSFLKKEENVKDVFLLGCYYFKVLDDETGRKIFLNLGSQLDKHIEYLVLIGELLFSRRLYDDALQTYDFLLMQSPPYADSIFKRKIDILTLQDDSKGIMTVYENVIHYDVKNISSYIEFIDYLISQKDYPNAERIIKMGYREFDRSSLISREARLLHVQGKTQDSLKLLTDYLKKDPFNSEASALYVELIRTRDDSPSYQQGLSRKYQRTGELKDFELLEYAYFYNDTSAFIKYVSNLKDSNKWVKLAEYLFARRNYQNCILAINTAVLKDSGLKKDSNLAAMNLLCLINIYSLKPSSPSTFGLLQIADRPGGISGFFSVVYERQDFFMKYNLLSTASDRLIEKDIVYDQLHGTIDKIKDPSLKRNAADHLITHYLNKQNDNMALAICRKFIKESEEIADRKHYIDRLLSIKRSKGLLDNEYIDYLKMSIIEFNDKNARYYLETYYKNRKQYNEIINFYSEIYR